VIFIVGGLSVSDDAYTHSINTPNKTEPIASSSYPPLTD